MYNFGIDRLCIVKLLLILLLVQPAPPAYSFGFKTVQQARTETSSICNRTRAVGDAIVWLIEGVFNCEDVTDEQLAAATGILRVRNERNKEINLRLGDFDGLNSLTALDLSSIRLSSLPAGLFDDLTSLEALYLWGNSIETLPENIFHSLDALKWLYLDQNKLTSPPTRVFSGLTSLTVLDLKENGLSDLPDELFNGLSELESLDLGQNKLETLPGNIFKDLSSLKTLYLSENSLESLPNGIFDGLSSLEQLELRENSLSTLQTGTFDGLYSLKRLELSQNDIATLSGEALVGLKSLDVLHLGENKLESMPEKVFAGLTSLRVLGLWENSIHTLPGRIFDELTSLEVLGLHQNSIRLLPENIFVQQTQMPLSTFYLEGAYYDFPGLSLGSNPGAPFRPVVKAGTDQSVKAGTTVSLSGEAMGPWGDLVRWEWTQVDASDVPVQTSDLVGLEGGNTATPSFSAPMVDGEYHFKLVVTPANKGMETVLWGHARSAPDWVTVRVDLSTDVTDVPEKVDFTLRGNYPNPLNSFTNIMIDLPQVATVSVDLFNTLGQRVHQAEFPLVAAGASKLLPLNIPGLPSGTYVYRVTAQTQEELHVGRERMTLIR